MQLDSPPTSCISSQTSFDNFWEELYCVNGCRGYDGCPKRLAGATGLEPAASCVTGKRSNQLNYAPAWDTLLLPSDIARFPLVSSRSLPLHLTVP